MELAATCVLLSLTPAANAISEQDILGIVVASCSTPDAPETSAAILDRATLEKSQPIKFQGAESGRRRVYRLTDNARITLETIAPSGSLRTVRAQYNDSDERPVLFVAASPDCDIRAIRKIEYSHDNRAVKVLHLDQKLQPTGTVDWLNPPLESGDQNDGVRVAMVDSGVNYLLPQINDRLARDENGELIGYDFWDLDSLPFDANPARSPFFPQRHGTRTASLILREAPDAVLVPYRYPRPDMTRMQALITHAHRAGTKIIGIPLGSNDISEWHTFAESARQHPEILFVVSAGNDGRSIDDIPVYPATLDMENLLVVTSADDFGNPAEGVNWGPESVDLLVPAERQLMTDFHGEEIAASGSSYAVSRVAALAARLLESHPQWDAQQLKREIVNQAKSNGLKSYVAIGLLADPLADTAHIRSSEETELGLDQIESTAADMSLSLNLVALEKSGWDKSSIASTVEQAADILAQCGIVLTDPRLLTIEVSSYLLDLSTGTAKTLVEAMELPSPTAYFVRDTRMEIPFDAQAFGRANIKTRPWLRDSVWLTAPSKDPGVVLAHELFHVLTDSGEHVTDAGNLMLDITQPQNTTLTSSQCELANKIGLTNGLLTRAVKS